MKIRVWHPEMSTEETKDLAYWERNVLALEFADGWYNDDILWTDLTRPGWSEMAPRYNGWRRVLSLKDGKITFHIPDDFEVGKLPEIAPNWDGHSTYEKWSRILSEAGVEHG